MPPQLALFLAHPGHELRVHALLEWARPVVHVLTDGSGSQGRSRLPSTRRLLIAAGARPGSIFGRLTDRELYQALLERNHALFCGLLDQLVDALRKDGAPVVAGDAAEGFNPGHDVARLLLNAAVQVLEGEGRRVENLEFPLEAAPSLGGSVPARYHLHLTPDALARKRAAAEAYREMAAEVQAAVDRHGLEALRDEYLFPAADDAALQARFQEPPAYEAYGEARVRSGVYPRVLRYREHMRPLALRLAEHAMARSPVS